MAVRRDDVQLHLDFITDESRALARTLQTTKEYNKEIASSTAKIAQYQKELAKVATDETKRAPILAKIAAEEKKVADNLARVAIEGKKVEKLDLTKLTPAQLTERARQLASAIRLIPQSAPQFKQLQTELSAVNGRLRELNQTAKGVSAGGGAGFFGSITSLGTRAIPIIAGITAAWQTLKGAFSGASDLEQVNVAFETFLGNADAARKVVADLRKFADVTPFETDQVNQAGKALLAFGFTAENLIPTLTEIGDVASGTGKDFNELVLIYGKAATEGKIQNDTLNQLAEAGIPVYTELAKVLGVNQDQIRKLAEQGKIQFTDLQAVFTNLTSEGGRFAGLMEKQSQTLGGLFSTLKSAVSNVLAQLGTALAPFIKQLLELAIPAVQKFGEIFSFVFRGVGGTLNGFVSAAKYTFEAAIASAESFSLKIQLGYARVLDFFGSDQAARIQELEGKISVASAKAGGSISESFIAGFNAVWQPATGETLQDAAAPGKPNAITRAITPNPEEAKKRAEAAFKAALAEVEVGIKRQELLIENARIKGQVDEEAYYTRLTEITEQGLNARLEVFRNFSRDQENEALELQNRLAEIQAGRALRNTPATATLPGRGTGQVTSQNPDQIDLGPAVPTVDALQARFGRLYNAEEAYLIAQGELRSAYYAEQLARLEASGQQESETYKKYTKEKEAADQSVADNKERLADFQAQLLDSQNQLFQDSAALAIELLGQDEAARKRNANAIKAFQVAQVTVQGIAEVQKIWAGAAELGPILGPIIGAIQTAAAIARTVGAVAKIQSTKFAAGGYTGAGYGSPDNTGFRPAGIVHEGEYVVPKRIVESASAAPVIRWLEGRRLRGFADGGLVTVNTTPTALPSFQSAAAPLLANMDQFINAVTTFQATVAAFPTEVKSRVVYTEIEDVGTELNTVRDDAAI